MLCRALKPEARCADDATGTAQCDVSQFEQEREEREYNTDGTTSHARAPLRYERHMPTAGLGACHMLSSAPQSFIFDIVIASMDHADLGTTKMPLYI